MSVRLVDFCHYIMVYMRKGSALALKTPFYNISTLLLTLQVYKGSTYDKTLTVFNSYDIITCKSVICTAYSHRDVKYTYIDTTRQSYIIWAVVTTIEQHF